MPSVSALSSPNSSLNGKPAEYNFKLLLIGDSGVGKTSLLFRYAEDVFTPASAYGASPSIGIDFKVRTIKVDTHRVKLQIWDTAGHERFRAITKSYYRGADGVLLVYDLTSTTSFDSITGWMASLNEHCERTVPRIIVGNKSDNTAARAVEVEQATLLATEHNCEHVETSAKTSCNVEHAFALLVRGILAQLEKDVQIEPCFGGLIRVRERIVAGVAEHTRRVTERCTIL